MLPAADKVSGHASGLGRTLSTLSVGRLAWVLAGTPLAASGAAPERVSMKTSTGTASSAPRRILRRKGRNEDRQDRSIFMAWRCSWCRAKAPAYTLEKSRPVDLATEAMVLGPRPRGQHGARSPGATGFRRMGMTGGCDSSTAHPKRF